MATSLLTACKALVVVVCICLVSVELAESRGAARRNQNRAARAGRSGRSRNMEKREDELLKCCLQPDTAVMKTATELVTEYDTEAGPDPANDWKEKRVTMEILVTNGINSLRKTERDDGIFVTVAGLERQDDCANYCYIKTTYFFPQDKKCYQYLYTGNFDSPQVGTCPIELLNAQVVDTDSATGVVTARGKDQFLGRIATARYKLVDGGCVPISIDYDLFIGDGYRQNSTRSWSENVVFEEEPFRYSYNDLLVLTNDDIKQCPY